MILSNVSRAIFTALLDGRDEDEPWGYTTPSALADELDYTREYMQTQLASMNTIGWVEREKQGFYRVTEKGIDEAESHGV